MKKVKFVRSHPSYAYFAGDEALLSEKEVKALVEEQYVTPVEESKGKNSKVQEPVEDKKSEEKEPVEEKKSKK